MGKSALICGGSIGGLFAAAALLRAGWHVAVFERVAEPLAGRGAGIVTHKELINALHHVGATTRDLGVRVTERVAYDLEGNRVQTLDHDQIVTSWDRMHQVLRALVPDDCYHMGKTATGYVDNGTSVTATFSDGTTATGDVLVGADGFRSAIRGQMLPDIQPEYAGYLVWRALAAEADLPDAVRTDIFNTFGFFLPDSTQIIGYPIAGPDNVLRPGHLRYNFVWYTRASQLQLDDLLTDSTGMHHDVSIPPPLIRDDVITRMLAEARQRLPGPFIDILSVSERPFFTPIYDHHAPVMAKGRIVLTGDAACVARPHVGMGVTKAAEDALALAQAVTQADLTHGLDHFSKTRSKAAHVAFAASRHLGRLVFDPAPGSNPDGTDHPHMRALMRDTATIPRADQ